MFGSDLVKNIIGSWGHVGYLTTDALAIPADTVIPKGTWMQEKTGVLVAGKMEYASGGAVGYTTEDIISSGGLVSNDRFRDRWLGNHNLAVVQSATRPVSLRVPHQGAEVEFEGAGTAIPGNLVCTSGTGALAAGTAVKSELSLHNGCIRLAQTGDVVRMILLEAGLTVESAIVGALRIRVRIVDGSVKD